MKDYDDEGREERRASYVEMKTYESF